MQTYVARYAHQSASELRAMALSTFYAWFYSVSELVKKENGPEGSNG